MRMLITGGLVARADGVFNTDILIEGDRILELGERLHEAQQPEGTEIVDVSGCVVMPVGDVRVAHTVPPPAKRERSMKME